jgi:hypothetical protein
VDDDDAGPHPPARRYCQISRHLAARSHAFPRPSSGRGRLRSKAAARVRA